MPESSYLVSRLGLLGFFGGLFGAAGLAASEPTTKPVVDPDLVTARMSFGAPPLNVVTLRSFDRLFDTEPVRAATNPTTMPKSNLPFHFNYQFDGKSYSHDDFLKRTYTNALVIVHDGRIVSERYRNGGDPGARYAVFSIAKSIVSMLIGIAIERGEIASVDVPITRYAPEFKGTAYDGVTLGQALQMRSGVAFDENGPSFFNFLEQVIAGSEQRCADFIKTAPRAHPPGSHFNYSSPETCVIARVLERATGQSLARYMETHLWRPGGMEHSGYWVLDGHPGIGTAIANGGFSATARDLARVGQIMLAGGMAKSRRIVPSDWVERSTASDADPTRERRDGYGYQWWTLANPDAFAGVGYNGQYLYVVPSQKLVIAKYSYWPTGGDDKLEAETKAAFIAIGRALTERSKRR